MQNVQNNILAPWGGSQNNYKETEKNHQEKGNDYPESQNNHKDTINDEEMQNNHKERKPPPWIRRKQRQSYKQTKIN